MNAFTIRWNHVKKRVSESIRSAERLALTHVPLIGFIIFLGWNILLGWIIYRVFLCLIA